MSNELPARDNHFENQSNELRANARNTGLAHEFIKSAPSVVVIHASLKNQ